MMAVDDDGLWVHSKFGLSVPRRNGKSEIDKMRELRGLFHGEHILHTAHRTAKHSAWIFTNVSLTGDDRLLYRDQPHLRHFYPHPPCGGRRAQVHLLELVQQFLSTSPLRGTTANVTENTAYFPAHLSQQDTAYKNTLRFCAGCGRFRGASARSALKMLCSPVRTARRFSAR